MHLWIQSLNDIGEHFPWLEQVCLVIVKFINAIFLCQLQAGLHSINLERSRDD